MKPNYLFIPILLILQATVGSYFTSLGLEKWYKSINLPKFTPPGKIIGWVWTGLFILTAASALLVWNSGVLDKEDYNVYGLLLLINGLMNVFWSYVFFYKHMIGYAVIQSAALGLSVLSLIIFAVPISLLAAGLLLPYLLWVSFATYLNYTIWKLNK